MASRKTRVANETLAVDPADLASEDVFEHAAKVMTPASIAVSERIAEELRAGLRLKELREIAGVTQSAVKGFKQESVSQIESRADLKHSTYKKYLEGLGYSIVTLAVPTRSRGVTNNVVLLEGEATVKIRRNTVVFDGDVVSVTLQRDVIAKPSSKKPMATFKSKKNAGARVGKHSRVIK